jgi:hypothetical protein
MSDCRGYSKVIKVKQIGRRLFLTLDCGHEVYRYSQSLPQSIPRKILCEYCRKKDRFSKENSIASGESECKNRRIMSDNCLGKHAVAKTASWPTRIRGMGEVIGYCDAPMVLVRRADGSKFWWRADLCEFSDAPTDGQQPEQAKE